MNFRITVNESSIDATIETEREEKLPLSALCAVVELCWQMVDQTEAPTSDDMRQKTLVWTDYHGYRLLIENVTPHAYMKARP